MFMSIYYKPSSNAHTMILIVHIFMNVNKLCLNQTTRRMWKFTEMMRLNSGIEKTASVFLSFILYFTQTLGQRTAQLVERPTEMLGSGNTDAGSSPRCGKGFFSPD